MAAFRETKIVQPEPKNLRGSLPMIGSHDEAIKQLVAAIRQLMAPPDPPKNEMGFHIIREPAKEQTESSKPTASAKPPKRRRRTNAWTTRQPTALRGPRAG
ncbi:MAG: hypothetical protein NT013_03225 [Planctomycetia bacterium]|nr:hypothetical protein [Planctomycetia bacterium]